jgi:hypothetical protein
MLPMPMSQSHRVRAAVPVLRHKAILKVDTRNDMSKKYPQISLIRAWSSLVEEHRPGADALMLLADEAGSGVWRRKVKRCD